MVPVLVRYISVLTSMVRILMTLCIIVALTLVVLVFVLKRLLRMRHRLTHAGKDQKISVGFFHPYCNAGGGGERVLWVAIKAIQNRYPNVRCVVYTGDTDAKAEDILSRAAQRFNIEIEKPVEFVYLRSRFLVEARVYPFLTLLGQSLGSVVLGMEALSHFVPTVYLDTMGYAFTMPVFRYLGGCRVGCYVHYPTISTDMLERVTQRVSAHNNSRLIAQSPLLSWCKLGYYNVFAALYGFAGRCSVVTMVNSSWTEGHINHIWKMPLGTFRVYPPCDVSAFEDIPLETDKKDKVIVSVAQFRPEKDHRLQIQSLRQFLDLLPEEERSGVRLVLVGSCRNQEDEHRVAELQDLAAQLRVGDNVEFKLNVSFQELKKQLAAATVGIHTMWNEHFGIGVVECMASGTIILAHNSGGPEMDIVTDYEGRPTGFLAATADEYAEKMRDIFSLTSQLQLEIRTNARRSVRRFGEPEFTRAFLCATLPLLA